MSEKDAAELLAKELASREVCVNAIAPYGTDPAAYRAQVAPMVAEANARQGAGMSQITAAALSGVQPLATRPFAAAPKVPGAPGFHCYSKRKLSTHEDDSACARTLEECRAMAKRDAKGGTYDVGHCQRQDAATCQDFAAQNSCDGHFSWTVTFQRK